MNFEELYQEVKDLNAIELYKGAQEALETKVNLMRLGNSPLFRPHVLYANKLRQALVCQYDFGTQLDPPTITPNDTVEQHRNRDPKGCQIALEKIIKAIEKIKIPKQKITKPRTLITEDPEFLRGLSGVTLSYLLLPRD